MLLTQPPDSLTVPVVWEELFFSACSSRVSSRDPGPAPAPLRLEQSFGVALAAPRRLPSNVNKPRRRRRLRAPSPPTPRPRRRGDAAACGTPLPSDGEVVCPRPGSTTARGNQGWPGADGPDPGMAARGHLGPQITAVCAPSSPECPSVQSLPRVDCLLPPNHNTQKEARWPFSD